MREHKKPTRRKMPSRRKQQSKNITYEDYAPPWTAILCGTLVTFGFIGITTLLGAGRMWGWW